MSVDVFTGPFQNDAIREEPGTQIAAPPPGSAAEPATTSAQLFSNRRELLKHIGGRDNSRRIALLGLLLSELQQVFFEDIAVLLDVKPPRLLAMIHGTVQVPPQREPRWESLAAALQNLHRILEPSATDQWLHTSVPDLDGYTPLEAIRRGQVEKILRLTESYIDPSFS